MLHIETLLRRNNDFYKAVHNLTEPVQRCRLFVLGAPGVGKSTLLSSLSCSPLIVTLFSRMVSSAMWSVFGREGDTHKRVVSQYDLTINNRRFHALDFMVRIDSILAVFTMCYGSTFSQINQFCLAILLLRLLLTSALLLRLLLVSALLLRVFTFLHRQGCVQPHVSSCFFGRNGDGAFIITCSLSDAPVQRQDHVKYWLSRVGMWAEELNLMRVPVAVCCSHADCDPMWLGRVHRWSETFMAEIRDLYDPAGRLSIAHTFFVTDCRQEQGKDMLALGAWLAQQSDIICEKSKVSGATTTVS